MFHAARKLAPGLIAVSAAMMALVACAPGTRTANMTVPREGDWGIYELDVATLAVRLVYSAGNEMQTSALRLSDSSDRLVFAQKIDGSADADMEIFSITTGGNDLKRLTDNHYFDLYPAWSPDGGRVAFISMRDKDLDIYVTGADGSNERRLFDSGSHDADIDWAGDTIVFTSGFSIWRMKADGTGATRITDVAGRGEWGKANLPIGDYDPRLSRDGQLVVFERLEDAGIPNGGYNLFTIRPDGTGETRLTNDGYSQGLASWSHSGDRIVYVVAAIGGEGAYDIYVANSDGTGRQNITPSYFPAGFLCHSPVFSGDDSSIFFIGQWWK